MSGFTIGRLSEQTGVKVETIRYYEKIGLLQEPQRTAAGYRRYDAAHLRRLQFIRRGRSLGFSIEAIRTLSVLTERPEQSCSAADYLACAHLAEIEGKIADLRRLRDEVRALTHCHADSVAACRIIDALNR
jgi:DNA-binding transcriptional MerR regulator